MSEEKLTYVVIKPDGEEVEYPESEWMEFYQLANPDDKNLYVKRHVGQVGDTIVYGRGESDGS